MAAVNSPSPPPVSNENKENVALNANQDRLYPRTNGSGSSCKETTLLSGKDSPPLLEPTFTSSGLPTDPIQLAKLKEKKRQSYIEALLHKKLNTYRKAYDVALERERAFQVHEVTFAICFNSFFGQNLYLVGSTKQLGQWSVEDASPLMWSAGNCWSCTLPLNAYEKIEYKYIVKDDRGQVTWEPGNNHRYDPQGGTAPKKIFNSWGSLQ